MIILKDYQVSAIKRCKNGSIICGGVGSGKSLTSLGYYYTINGGILRPKYYEEDGKKKIGATIDDKLFLPKDLIIITTAHKRDLSEWDRELYPLYMSRYPEANRYKNHVYIDSWNNINKYTNFYNSFFIFDEQRVVGSGSWVKSFLKITKNNKWILLSATPGDTWTDYIPVFIANGFYKNRKEFIRSHVIYNHHVSFPQIDRYIDENKLERLRREVLIEMGYVKKTTCHHEYIIVNYDRDKYKKLLRDRSNPYEKIIIKGKEYQKPIQNASEFCSLMRRVVNSDPSRAKEVLNIINSGHNKVIIFYNFNFELDILKSLNYGDDFIIAEWNGKKHEKIPDSEKWVYLVQYNAGSEGWECIKTDTMIFFSECYSYRCMEQSSGRIDRNNSPYKDLYYYHLRSTASIDLAIKRSLDKKRNFNVSAFCKKVGGACTGPLLFFIFYCAKKTGSIMR